MARRIAYGPKQFPSDFYVPAERTNQESFTSSLDSDSNDSEQSSSKTASSSQTRKGGVCDFLTLPLHEKQPTRGNVNVLGDEAEFYDHGQHEAKSKKAKQIMRVR